MAWLGRDVLWAQDHEPKRGRAVGFGWFIIEDSAFPTGVTRR
jgi:hypothetical protein